MEIRKLRKLDRCTAGITVPKDDLRAEGLLDDEGNLIEGEHVAIEKVGDGEWRVSRFDAETVEIS
ncbi:hypothetical protein RH858_08105 [Halalkaliarchaeum sp. AArc-GB]|uniref:hypothetical protein n=1 Tax=Halalkaliarchaeum sp. AArc-GB TaxID=3074078 RepID=UPI00285FD2B0|nr:hypothetical protein [Halalkaliarchaeum sp. AArc-GB]MDR5673111.1 hypothetical protein [Halalkaliarchaeum sp. AArc-GB]